MRMIFKETAIRGAFIIDIEKQEDYRGFYARAWCEKVFESYGLTTRFVQANIPFAKKKGTLRGLPYQVAPILKSNSYVARGVQFMTLLSICGLHPGLTSNGSQ